MDARGTPAEDEILFEAAIVPHRSLSPRGQRVLLGLVFALLALTGARFWLLGAWPVAGFIVVELGLAAFLMRLHRRSARRMEMLLLSAREVRVLRTDPDGRRRELRMPTAWLAVELEEKSGSVPALVLRNRERQIVVAAALGDAEKRDLAEMLRAVLHDIHNPRFDNPQLRNPT